MEVERLREEKRELTRRATEAEGRLKEVEVECITQLDGLADENARLCEENKSLLARVSTLQSMNLQLAGQVAELEGRCGVVDGAAVAAELKVQARGLSPSKPGGSGGGGGGEPGALINDLVQARRATVVADGGEAAGGGDAAAAADAAAEPNGHANGNTSRSPSRSPTARGRGPEHPALRLARRGRRSSGQVGAVGIGALVRRPHGARGQRRRASVVGGELSPQEGSDGPRRQTHAAPALIVALGAAEGGGRQLPTVRWFS